MDWPVPITEWKVRLSMSASLPFSMQALVRV